MGFIALEINLMSLPLIYTPYFKGDVDEFGEIMLWTAKPKSAENKIKGVLKLIRNDKYEVPFIGTYRKEIIQVSLIFQKSVYVYHI